MKGYDTIQNKDLGKVTTMTNKTLLSLATVAFFATTAGAYEVESTNYWFTAEMYVAHWTNAESGATDLEPGIAVDKASDSPILYTPVATTNDGYRVKASVRFVENATLPSVPSNNTQAALGALTIYDGKWYAVSNACWIALYGASAPEDDTTYNVTLDFKKDGVQKLVRYSVDGTVLTNAGNVAWFPRGHDEANVTKFGVAGYGDITSLSADTVSFFEITIPEGSTNAYNIAALTPDELNRVGGNGLTKWQSLVLGLPDDNTVPYIAPAQNATTNTIAFTYGNLNPRTDTTASVVFDVYSMPSVDGATSFATNSVNGVAEVPADSNNVKYYKVKIRITK